MKKGAAQKRYGSSRRSVWLQEPSDLRAHVGTSVTPANVELAKAHPDWN
jgi:hypothetical protein